jgi:hypothetical protein
MAAQLTAKKEQAVMQQRFFKKPAKQATPNNLMDYGKSRIYTLQMRVAMMYKAGNVCSAQL